MFHHAMAACSAAADAKWCRKKGKGKGGGNEGSCLGGSGANRKWRGMTMEVETVEAEGKGKKTANGFLMSLFFTSSHLGLDFGLAYFYRKG